MTNLATINHSALASLDDRSRARCVVYRNHPLPPGCDPTAADLGVEQTGSTTLLHVRRGVSYDGPDDQVRDWVETGTREFGSLDDSLHWLREQLTAQRTQQAPDQAVGPRPINEVTDLSLVAGTQPTRLAPADLGQILSTEVLGQESAVRGLATLAANHLAKPHPRRPASALLVGASGTGKTLAAEQLALHLTSTTNSEWSYERLDMNEFSEQHSASRLFGAPPGYVGYGDGRDLAAALRNNPRTVVVLDEIDKAHPQLWRSLMSLMDAGRLGGQGGDIDARQAILLFTSNKDAAAIQPLTDAPDQRLRRFLRDHGYPPEIVGRIGRILVFRPLSGEITAQLIVLTLQRVAESYGLDLARVAPEAVAELARRAPVLSGGRDLEYSVEQELAEQMAALSGTATAIEIGPDLAVTPRGR